MAAKLYAGSTDRPAEHFEQLNSKYAFLRLINNLLLFSLACIKTQWDDVPCLVRSLAHLSWMKHLGFVCRYVEPFRSYAIPADGESAEVRRNLSFPPPNF